MSFYGTHVSDISPLSGLTQLEILIFNNSEVSDLTPLKTSTKLRSLEAAQHRLENLSGLEHATGLTSINLAQNPIHDIRPLVDNQGLGVGVDVNLTSTPLLAHAIDDQVHALQARSVNVILGEGTQPN